jgi:hypothetical protein
VARVAIVGSRRFPDLGKVEKYVQELPPITRLLTGSASGVDAAATRAARRHGLALQILPASFEELNDPAQAAARNQRLIDQCDSLVAFWDGASPGTRATIDRALDSGREVHVFICQATVHVVS